MRFADVFVNFVYKEVGGPYWRPVTWTADVMTKYFYGYNPIPYHLTNIIVYASICILLFYFLKKIGFDYIRAWVGAFVFAVLPQHELSVAWVAGRTDTFMALFLLISILFFLQNPSRVYAYILSAFFFLLSILSKEPAFAGAALPLMFYYLRNDESLTKRNAYTASAIAFLLVGTVLLYRYIFIGGSPFDSGNFQGSGLRTMILNFIAYIPISFIRADTLQIIEHYIFTNRIILVISILFVLSSIVLIILRLRRIDSSNRRKFFFGLIWFVIFILPATYYFGQWYAFTASAGLIISILSLIDIDISRWSGKIILSLIIIAGVISSVNLNYRSTKWHYAANISHSAFGSINYNAKERDTLILLGVPDKVDMINCAKIGCAQAVWYKLKSKQIEVSSPLRIEMQSDAVISFQKMTDSTIKMKITNGRFLRIASRSRAVIIPETMNYEDGFQKFTIKTETQPAIVSTAIITIKEKSLRDRIFIFTGRHFYHLK